MYQEFLKEIEERFLRYVQIDTQSAEDSAETPSTAKQLDLLRMLEGELKALGAKGVALTDYGCVLATIPATVEGDIPTIAFLALLKEKLGEDIITASGTTLLGADDKAGVAVIMALVSHLLSNPDIPHGDIRICFTPDEEVGRGVENLTLDDLAASVAYTLDGEDLGRAVHETFSADKGVVKITGVSIHAGMAKGKRWSMRCGWPPS